MNHVDLFVGAISVLLGMGGLLAAIVNHDFYYRLDKIRWLESKLSRRGVRCLYALLGLTLIAWGIAIALGFRTT